MSATDELRHLLNERGIEHHDHDHSDVRVTEWDNGGKRDARYEEWSSGTLRLDASNVTAEQAVTATMGDDTPVYLCPKCGVAYELEFIDKEFGKPNYCPHCGYRRLYA